ncbi:hypothetical protein SAY87_009324 [Trapa incisa]|uniref:YABBY2 n=1 Tax=Trapa incisa TaxID=236973 RepID=A0AAN7PWS1_9MYRT|nr:hypothetical protein SAY87_009324 [Trapa incisa]
MILNPPCASRVSLSLWQMIGEHESVNFNEIMSDMQVSVPCSSLFKTVTIRCGHCANLFSVNMGGLLPSPVTAANQLQLGHATFPPNILEEIRNTPPTMLMNHHLPSRPVETLRQLYGGNTSISRPTSVNRPPQKRQRVPSAYNRFIKEEIQRIKALNPDISHREAFSAAAKNWAHFPNIHFGLTPDHQPVKKSTISQQEGEDMVRKDGLLTPANLGVSPH